MHKGLFGGAFFHPACDRVNEPQKRGVSGRGLGVRSDWGTQGSVKQCLELASGGRDLKRVCIVKGLLFSPTSYHRMLDFFPTSGFVSTIPGFLCPDTRQHISLELSGFRDSGVYEVAGKLCSTVFESPEDPHSSNCNRSLRSSNRTLGIVEGPSEF
jgi:hypothetical protein